MKDVFLYKWGADESLTLEIPAGSYDSLIFGLGLSPALNNSNPNAFDNSHPLSIAQDMFWPMLKYRFVLLEGAVDTTVAMNGPVTFPISYHLGADELYRRIAIHSPFTIAQGGTHSLTLPVELKAIFDGPAGVIDMRTHFANHSTDLPKAAIMIDNLAAILNDI